MVATVNELDVAAQRDALLDRLIASGAITGGMLPKLAACTEAPCLQVNYRYFHRITHAEFDALVDELRAGDRDDIPPHGTLAKVRQHIPAERRAGAVAPTDTDEPVWLVRNRTAGDGGPGGAS